MAEQDPRLRAALENARREKNDAVSGLRTLAASIRKEHETFKRERDGRRDQRAKAAREGELGPDLQRLQMRIDRNETSWDDVIAGRDNHPSAVVARQNIRTKLEEIAEEVQQDPEFVEEQLELQRKEARMRADRENP